MPERTRTPINWTQRAQDLAFALGFVFSLVAVVIAAWLIAPAQ